MGTIIVILGIAIVITCFIHIWVDNLAMKRAIGKDDSPSYISDMENKLDKANIELNNAMKGLSEEVSKVIAREIPKVVANGNDELFIYLLYKYRGDYIGYPSVQITEAQYNLISRHKGDTKWVDSQLLAGGLSQYVMVYYVWVDYSWDSNKGITLNIRLRRKSRG